MPPKQEQKSWKDYISKRLTRDSLLFIVGLGGTIHELFISQLDRPGVLVFLAGLLGLPAFLRKDEKKAEEK